MTPEIKHRIRRIAILSLIAFAVGAGMAYKDIKGGSTSPSRTQDKGFSPVAGITIGGDYTLTDHNGNTVTPENFVQSYKLIYFGFTSCPAICPTELQKISVAMNELPPETAAKIQPLFISVDPARDTVAAMQNYVTLFHPRLVGLTGTQEQIDDALKKFRIYARKVQEEGMSDYTMDHSSYIYFMSPQDELLSIYKIDDPAEYIVKDINAMGIDGK